MMYDLLMLITLLIIGFVVGSIVEKRHFKSIQKRENESLSLPVTNFKKSNIENIENYKLVVGSVVISIDFFKKFFAGLVNFFGGNITSYETLLDRARREAILRMKEDALMAKEIINVKIETSSISKNTKGNVGAVEVIAYGTAIY